MISTAHTLSPAEIKNPWRSSIPPPPPPFSPWKLMRYTAPRQSRALLQQAEGPCRRHAQPHNHRPSYRMAPDPNMMLVRPPRKCSIPLSPESPLAPCYRRCPLSHRQNKKQTDIVTVIRRAAGGVQTSALPPSKVMDHLLCLPQRH